MHAAPHNLPVRKRPSQLGFSHLFGNGVGPKCRISVLSAMWRAIEDEDENWNFVIGAK